jgi:uncharacterized protein
MSKEMKPAAAIQDLSNMVKLEPLALPTAPFMPAGVPPLQLKESDLEGRTALRTSSYTIYVDLPGNSDDMLLVHAYTGAYDLISKRVATYLRSMESRFAPKPLYGDWTPEPAVEGEIPRPSDESIAILKKRGYLVTLSPEEEEALFTKLTAQHHFASLRRVPGYILMPTYQCNLRCPYCFQDHMRTKPEYSHLLKVMDRKMADRILKGMRNIEAAHGYGEDAEIVRNLTFFGGEPLLAKSRPIVQYFIEQLRARGRVDLSAVTNATELDAYEDLLDPKNGIAALQVTLDGPPKEHDRRRIYADGSGSFDRIAKNLTMALDKGVFVSVRMNIDRNNISQIPELAEVFQAQGWAGRDNFRPYAAAINASTENVAQKTTFNSWQLSQALQELVQQHPSVATIAVTDDSLQMRARQIFDKKATSNNFSTSFCGAHTGMYVLDAFGDMYACWERTGDTKLRIGHIEESGDVLMNRALLDTWRGRNVVSNPVCRKCRYATSCGGGCAVLAEATSGVLYKNFCDGYAQRFRANVAKAYMAHLKGEKQAATFERLCEA